MNEKKIAIVTGGTRGIGKEITLSLANDGIKVFALFARNKKSANALIEKAKKENFDIETVRGDLTREDDFERVISFIKDKVDKIDIIVHSAASGVHNDATSLTVKHMRWTFEINVFSIQKLLSEMVPLMRENGRIVGITSSGGTRVIPYYAAIGSSKGALESLFRHYARELAPREIAVNLVCPGMVLTDAINAFPEKDLRIATCLTQTPTSKMTTSEEVAELVSFLCTSKCGGQIIGQTLVIDGGKLLLS